MLPPVAWHARAIVVPVSGTGSKTMRQWKPHRIPRAASHASRWQLLEGGRTSATQQNGEIIWHRQARVAGESSPTSCRPASDDSWEANASQTSNDTSHISSGTGGVMASCEWETNPGEKCGSCATRRKTTTTTTRDEDLRCVGSSSTSCDAWRNRRTGAEMEEPCLLLQPPATLASFLCK